MPFATTKIVTINPPPAPVMPLTPVFNNTYEGEWVNWTIGDELKREFVKNNLNFFRPNANAIVFGNGTSRMQDVVEKIKHSNSKKIINYYNILYVCNLGYKDIEPDFLVVTNKLLAAKMPRELYGRTYTRPEIFRIKPEMNLIPINYTMDAGSTAAMLACYHGATRVFLYGFDGFPENKQNNLYLGEQFYPTGIEEEASDSKWQEDLGRVISAYPNTMFYRVNTSPPNARQLLKLSNYKVIDSKTFISLADI